jgi:hypothetical protein
MQMLPVIAGIISNVALANGCNVINGFDFPLPTYAAGYVDDMTQDALHPNAQGANVFARCIINALGGGGENSITVDSTLSSASENPGQNKVIKSALDGKGAVAAIPASGSVSAAGVLSFANSAGTQLFTVQLPLYAGGVS